MNRTLYNRARTLLIETGLPKNLWTEAITCATYQLNRCPSSAIQFKTPAEIMFGDRDLSKLRAFGSKVWVLTMPKRDKLDERAKEMRMTGYAPNGYRLWDPSNNKIVISRDLKFDENDIKYIENKQEETQRRYFEEEEKEEYQNRETEQQFEEREEVTRETHMYERPVRERRLPTYLKDYQMENEGQDNSYDANIAFCLFNNSEDPETFEEAISKGEEWKTAIDSEISSLEEMNTWEEAKLPDDKKAIDTKWIFRTKQNGKKKARLVAKGFQTDSKYNVYSPVARVSTIRMMLSQAVQEDLPIRQLDVPTAFLNGYLSEAVYIKPPEGIRVKEGHVLKLRRSLYGLREAPKCWNERFNDFIVKQGFEQSYYDYCLYVNKDVWILIWVDDILLMGNSKVIMEELRKEFKVRDLGEIKEYLGMEIIREKEELKICQTKLINKVLEKFQMSECKGIQTPMEQRFLNETEEVINNVPYRELIGCLTYISTISRPDITYTTSFLSRYLDKPTKELWISAKRVLRYLKQTMNMCLTYTKSKSGQQLIAYTDADWGSAKDDRKSVSGCAIFHNNNLVSWFSKKQSTVALSTAEAEYVAAAMATAELIYLRGILLHFNCITENKYLLLTDNLSAIKMVENNENSKRTKHIDIKYHYIKDCVRKKLIQISYVSTNENIADILTKSLPTVKHSYFVKSLGLV